MAERRVIRRMVELADIAGVEIVIAVSHEPEETRTDDRHR